MAGSKRIATLLVMLTPIFPLAAAAEDAPSPGTFKIPGTESTLKVYGFVEVDGTYDLNGRTSDINNNDWASFVPVQPLDNGGNEPRKNQVYLTGRTSRLGLMSTTPTGLGPLNVRLEADFNAPNDFQGELTTNGTAFRVRQAYGELGGLLIGQTWSTFFDPASTPDTVDFNPGTALALTRQPQVRYTFPLGTGASLALAVENARSLAFSGDFDSVPDFMANFTYSGSKGHVSVRGVTHEFRNNAHNKRAYGAGIAGSFKIANETIIASVQGGNGIGRYLFNALLQGAFDTGDEIELWQAAGYHIGITHAWSPTLRSNIIWSQTFLGGSAGLQQAHQTFATEVAKTNDLLPNKRVDLGFVNTFWSFAKNTEVGLEYAYGRRTTFARELGTQHRVNALARFTLY